MEYAEGTMRASVVCAVLLCLCAAVAVVSAARGRHADDGPAESPMDGRWKTVDYYTLLGVDRNAKFSAVEVNKAYRIAAHRHHPDKFSDRSKYSAEELKEAEKRFARLVDAMKTLRNRQTRENYDVLLKNGKVDYSEVDWNEWNEKLWKAYEEYAENFDHEAYERDSADFQLWLGGGATAVGLGLCVWWIYGDQLQKMRRDHERRQKRRSDREKAAASPSNGTTERRHKADKGVKSPKAAQQ